MLNLVELQYFHSLQLHIPSNEFDEICHWGENKQIESMLGKMFQWWFSDPDSHFNVRQLMERNIPFSHQVRKSRRTVLQTWGFLFTARTFPMNWTDSGINFIFKKCSFRYCKRCVCVCDYFLRFLYYLYILRTILFLLLVYIKK